MTTPLAADERRELVISALRQRLHARERVEGEGRDSTVWLDIVGIEDAADAVLALTALEGWQEKYAPLPDREKIGTVWRSLDGNVFATVDGFWRISLPAPIVAEQREVKP